MVRSWKHFVLLCSVALFAVACPEKPDVVSTVTERSTWSAPAQDMTPRCSDVGDLRVCWGAEAHGTDCRNGICVFSAPLPDVPAPDALGWRCSGSSSERTCAPRSVSAAPFQCAGGHCTQPHPRLPDDGEWSCIDSAGAVVCLGGEAPAGVAVGAADNSWHCAPRRAAGGAPGSAGSAEPRVCVDLSPDFPDGRAQGWACHYERQGVATRVCERDPSAHVLSDACSSAEPCVDGAQCIAGRCVPGDPHPSCWLDTDCPNGACRFGTCREHDG